MTTGATIGTSSGTTVNSGPSSITPSEDEDKLLRRIRELEVEVERLKEQA